MVSNSNLPLLRRAENHADRVAIVDEEGTHTYGDLLVASRKVSSSLLRGRADLCEVRIAFMVPPRFEYPVTQWGIWRAGGVAVPLCVSHPRREIEQVVQDIEPDTIVYHPEFEDKVRPLAEDLNIRLLSIFESETEYCALPQIALNRRAMILYTSGTTGRPKGAVTTHRSLMAQITSLIDAWGWSGKDRILNVLPLHHTHGIVNVLLCALWAGATCEMLSNFDEKMVWDQFLGGQLTLFMAVPTIYVKLLAAWERAAPDDQKRMSSACAGFRLMVSGSAALPVDVFEKWKNVSHQFLLERYGMTEIGMALSNPLLGERRPGFVGSPLPGVRVRLVDELGKEIQGEGVLGELQVRGPSVFLEYWGQSEATQRAFIDGWFRTGDIALIERESYRILGRRSVDIIKSGGFKVSALEIEEVLRTHPAIQECVVVGVDDEEWGERVCAAVVVKLDCSLSIEELREWGRQKLASYKVPSRLLSLEHLPRNVMGKLNKPELKRLMDIL